jgi:hypothetical protein
MNINETKWGLSSLLHQFAKMTKIRPELTLLRS